MNQQVRGSGQVMYAAVYAIIVRDIQKKFIKSVNTPRSLAFLWVIVEPIIHIGVWMLFRIVIKHNLNTTLPMPLFILLGAIPFLLFRNVINSGKTSIKANKSFFLFRQIKPIDPIIAKLISELLVNTFVFLILLVVFIWFSIEWHIYNPMFWLVNVFAYAIFLLGLSIILAVTCFFFNFLDIILNILMRFVYLLSGIFYSAELIPKQLRDVMLYNPIFQFIELTRECFMPNYSYIPYASSTYLIKSALITLMFAMALYLAMRERIMIEIEQR